MADFKSKDDQRRVLEFADNPVNADPVPPKASVVDDETFPTESWVFERPYPREADDDPSRDRFVELLKLFSDVGDEDDFIAQAHASLVRACIDGRRHAQSRQAL